jgi:hypothetical protein
MTSVEHALEEDTLVAGDVAVPVPDVVVDVPAARRALEVLVLGGVVVVELAWLAALGGLLLRVL